MNTLPLNFIPAKPYHARRRRQETSSPSPVALTLVAATRQIGSYVELTFDRAIDISGIDVAAFFLDDGVADFKYQGYDTAIQPAPNVVQVQITGIEDGGDPGVHLTVGAGSGIVAVDDGGTWAGVTGLELPFP